MTSPKISLSSPVYVISAINKKTNAAGWKDVKVGDMIRLSIDGYFYAHYANYAKCYDVNTKREWTCSLAQLNKYMPMFEYDVLQAKNIQEFSIYYEELCK